MQYKTEKDIIKSIKEFEKKTNNKKLQLIKDSVIKNLYLCIRATKNNTHISFIYRYKLNSKIYSITISQYNTLSLVEVGEIAKQYNNILQSQEFKQYNKDNNKDLKSYVEATKALQDKHALHSIIDKWLKSKSHVRQITLNSYIRHLNIIKSYFDNTIHIHHITKQDLLHFLSQYNNKPNTLKKLYKILHAIFEYALLYDLIQDTPFKSMKYNKMFAIHTPIHHKALNEKELQEILHLLNNAKSHFKYKSKQDKVIQLCLKFGIYTALRKHNLINLEWSEVNFKDKMLVIPSNKMKNKKTFKLPLSQQALSILEYMDSITVDKYVFSFNLTSIAKTRIQIDKALQTYKQALTSDKPLSLFQIAKDYKMPYSNLYRIMKKINTTKKNEKTENKQFYLYERLRYINKKLSFTFKLHSLRSTFSTMLYEKTPLHKIDFIIIEMCLSHDIGNQVITSYNFSERLNERRELMQFWANYIDSINETRQLKKVGNLTILDINDNLSF